LSYETIADNIVKVGPEKLAALFNGAIRCLAEQGLFAKRIEVSLDATDDEATPTYKTDTGGAVPSVTREKRPDVRANKHAKKIKVTVFGWKIWLVLAGLGAGVADPAGDEDRRDQRGGQRARLRGAGPGEGERRGLRDAPVGGA